MVTLTAIASLNSVLTGAFFKILPVEKGNILQMFDTREMESTLWSTEISIIRLHDVKITMKTLQQHGKDFKKQNSKLFTYCRTECQRVGQRE